jgi:hypothetical protein
MDTSHPFLFYHYDFACAATGKVIGGGCPSKSRADDHVPG